MQAPQRTHMLASRGAPDRSSLAVKYCWTPVNQPCAKLAL